MANKLPINHRCLAIWGGHFVECFDNTLYGFFAVLLAPVFFPPTSDKTQVLASFGAFAIGYLARPLGAFIFGLIGDTKGRQISIIWSMLLVSLPTIIIGLIPSYHSLGIASSILLLFCRVLQGICIGGEFTGVNIYNAEDSNNADNLGERTGILLGVGVLGAVCATMLGALFSTQIMPSWAWRIPFIFGGCLAIIVGLFRFNITETEDFIITKQKNHILANPWTEILIHHKSSILLASIISGLTIVPLYCSTILANQMFKELGYSVAQSLSLNTFSMIIDAILLIGYGKMADYLGFHRQMLLGTALTALLVCPAFYIVSGSDVTTMDVFTFILLLVVSGGIINGCAMPYMANFFPVNCRYSALAFSVTFGHAIFGGTTPLVCSYMQFVAQSRFAAAFWVFAIASIAFLGIFFQKQKKIQKPSQFVTAN